MSDLTEASTALMLTQKEEAFCLAVFAGQKPSTAYRETYAVKQAKPETIHAKSSRLMAKAKIRARIAELRQPVIARAQMCRGEWLEALVRICRSDVRKMFDSHGNPKEITELGDNEAAAIAAFEFCEDYTGKAEERRASGYTRRFKLIDKLKAFELYGKAMGFYAERQELAGKNGEPLSITVEFVEAPREREAASDTSSLTRNSNLKTLSTMRG